MHALTRFKPFLALSLLLLAPNVSNAQPVRGVAGDLWADLVLGQPNFGGNPFAPFGEQKPNAASSSRIFNPSGVVVDRFSSPQRLYVFDGGNSRVLGFSDISHAACSGSNASATPLGADMVLGQPDFTHTACNGDSGFQNYPTYAQPTANNLCSMQQDEISPLEAHYLASMAVDPQGDLYVPDFFNNRILRYDGSSLVAGAMGVAASHEWGQADFTHGYRSCGPPSADNLCFSSAGEWGAGAGIDPSGNLWVADSGNNRVLRFPVGAGGVPQATADLVLGQTGGSFTSTTGASSASDTLHLANPLAVRVDSAGNVYVIDEAKGPKGGRVAVYLAPVTSSQPINFVETQYIGTPWSLELDPTGGLWVGDRDYIQAVLFNVSPSNPTNFTPLKVLLRNQAWDGTGTAPAPSGGDGLDFNYQDGGTQSSYGVGSPPIAGIGVDSSGNVFLTTKDWMQDVWRFPAPIPTPQGSIAHSADWAVFKPPQMGMFNGMTDDSFFYPAGVAFIPATLASPAQLVVADGYRLLYWNMPSGVSSLSNGKPADGIAGTTTPYYMHGSQFSRIHTDQAGHLWVLRGWNGNVFIEAYNTPLSNGAMAAVTISSGIPVLGGGTLNWSGANGLQLDDLAPDPAGQYLWASDQQNNRVFRVRNPLTSPQVDIVLGQPNATANSCNGGGSTGGTEACNQAPTQYTFTLPGALSLDLHGNLYVSDNSLEFAGNNRLLRFDAATIQNASPTSAVFGVGSPGIPAAAVYGRGGSFTATSCVSTAGDICAPWRVAFTSDNSVMVAGENEYGGSRFPILLSNPTAGDTPMGHLNDFTTQPYSAVFDDQNNLYMTDINKNRLLVYLNPFSIAGAPPTPTPSGTQAPASPTPTPANSPTSTNSLTATPTSSGIVLRMNSSGPAYTDPSGNLWMADQAYSPGGFGYVNGSTATNPSGPSPLYQTIRWGNSGFDYEAAVSNGTYQVTLKFIENVYTQPGLRVFNVLAGGSTVLANLDIYQAAGGTEVPLDETFSVTVTGGLLDLTFQSLSTGAPSVCAVQILSLHPPTPTPTATPTMTSTTIFTTTSSSTVTPTNSPTVTATFTTTFTSTSTPTYTVAFTPTSSPTVTTTFTVTSTPTEGCHDPGFYPNPCPDSLRLHFSPCDEGREVHVKIFTLADRKVLDKDIPVVPVGVDMALELKDNWGIPLANGLYYLVLDGPDGRRTIGKLLILR